MQLFVLDTLVRHAARVRRTRKRHTCRLRLESNRAEGDDKAGRRLLLPAAL
ncbi:hypothetical protein ALC57_00635 [Trachymyrmex cornetzi]|uniref:Uncharacterized protein n=1 Tax=Trachymyrmex cornetzi TaxID=471704 RepID=A0A151JRR3_9HYME|nr:hypothetical protein ALC57_00635 [Trachymyrmex cornetzi]